jgi:aminoglycoside phosphotransferase (APT) family kinase protein
MDHLIRAICQKEGLRPGVIQPLQGGQVNQVYRIDHDYVLRIGEREGAFQRLKSETGLLQSLAGEIPVPEIVAFGEQEDKVYQIQKFVPGQKLHTLWRDMSPVEQEAIAAELAGYLKVLHGRATPHFGYLHEDAPPPVSWADYLSAGFHRTLEEIAAYHFRMAPGFIELAAQYFDEHQQVLQDATPALVHGDLSFVNILVHQGKISAILDFEYAMQAPKDYELLVMEEFCLYPNDYAEEDNEVFCTADFAGFFQLLRKHDPELFEVPHLRERLDLYHLQAALGSYIAWRKANLRTIPADRMASQEFYMARIANFTFRHGVRLF